MTALVQNSTAFGSGTATLPGGSTLGNLLIAHISNRPSGASNITAPSGWLKAYPTAGSSNRAIFYYPNNPGGLSSFVFSGDNGVPNVFISEWSGVFASAAVRSTGATTTASSPITSTDADAALSADELAVGVVYDSLSVSGTTTLGAGTWTKLFDNGSTAGTTHVMAVALLTSVKGVATSNTSTSSSGNVNGMGSAIASFSTAALPFAVLDSPDFSQFPRGNETANPIYADFPPH